MSERLSCSKSCSRTTITNSTTSYINRIALWCALSAKVFLADASSCFDALHPPHQLSRLPCHLEGQWWQFLGVAFGWRVPAGVVLRLIASLKKLGLAFFQPILNRSGLSLPLSSVRCCLSGSFIGSREHGLDGTDDSADASLNIYYRFLTTDSLNQDLDGLDKLVGLVFNVDL